MWDLPRRGLEPISPALAGGFLSTVQPGKSPCSPFQCWLCVLSFPTNLSYGRWVCGPCWSPSPPPENYNPIPLFIKPKPYSIDGSAFQQYDPDPLLVTVSTFSVTVDFSSWFTVVLVTSILPRIHVNLAFCRDADFSTWGFQFLNTLNNCGHSFHSLSSLQFPPTVLSYNSNHSLLTSSSTCFTLPSFIVIGPYEGLQTTDSFLSFYHSLPPPILSHPPPTSISEFIISSFSWIAFSSFGPLALYLVYLEKPLYQKDPNVSVSLS